MPIFLIDFKHHLIVFSFTKILIFLHNFSQNLSHNRFTKQFLWLQSRIIPNQLHPIFPSLNHFLRNQPTRIIIAKHNNIRINRITNRLNIATTLIRIRSNASNMAFATINNLLIYTICMFTI